MYIITFFFWWHIVRVDLYFYCKTMTFIYETAIFSCVNYRQSKTVNYFFVIRFCCKFGGTDILGQHDSSVLNNICNNYWHNLCFCLLCSPLFKCHFNHSPAKAASGCYLSVTSTAVVCATLQIFKWTFRGSFKSYKYVWIIIIRISMFQRIYLTRIVIYLSAKGHKWRNSHL